MAAHFDGRSRKSSGGPLRNLNREDAREFFEELARLCVRDLRATGQFAIPHIGKLVVESRGPRHGRHPLTGKSMVIPARRVVRARISSRIRDEIEEPLDEG